MTVTKPTTLFEVQNALSDMYVSVMNDRNRCAQVHEGANALGKVNGACKIHLEACKLAGSPPTGEWKEFLQV